MVKTQKQIESKEDLYSRIYKKFPLEFVLEPDGNDPYFSRFKYAKEAKEKIKKIIAKYNESVLSSDYEDVRVLLQNLPGFPPEEVEHEVEEHKKNMLVSFDEFIQTHIDKARYHYELWKDVQTYYKKHIDL